MNVRATIRFLLASTGALAGWALLLPVLVVAYSVWGLNGIVSRVARWREPEVLPWTEFHEFDPVLGWKPRPHMDAYYYLGRDDIHRAVTDGDGWPGTWSLEESPLVVFGDSFAFGTGMDTDKAFMSLTRGFSTKAIGAPGYSMVQPVLLMRRLASALAGKVVVWFVYVENDLHDNLMPANHRHRNPFVRRHPEGSWEIVTEHLSPEPWTLQKRNQPNLHILAHLCTPCALSERVYSAATFLLAQGSAACEAAGARLVVVSIPNVHQLSPAGLRWLRERVPESDSLDPSYPDRRLQEACEALAVPFVPGKEILSADDYKRFEKFHWTESGHRKVARLLEELYRGRSDPAAGGPEPRGPAPRREIRARPL